VQFGALDKGALDLSDLVRSGRHVAGSPTQGDASVGEAANLTRQIGLGPGLGAFRGLARWGPSSRCSRPGIPGFVIPDMP
jgi:hypothetical protein